MNLTQITAFRSVMSSSSISQAARALGRTQPAVSLAIRNLEQSLGMALFERQGRRLIPVPEAHYLMAESEAILDRLAVASRTMKMLASGQAGNLTIAAAPSCMAYLLPRFLADAIARNPGVKISISTHGSKRIQELVSSQIIDFGFADAPVCFKENPLDEIEIIRANSFAAIHWDHKLAKQKSISVADLDGEPLGTMQSGHASIVRLKSILQKNGVRFHQVVDSLTVLPLLQFVRTGACIAIVDPLTVASEQCVDSVSARVVFRPIAQKIGFDYAFFLPRHRPMSQLARMVMDDWKREVFRLLNAIDADPVTLNQKTNE